jgi:hypothetical protein
MRRRRLVFGLMAAVPAVLATAGIASAAPAPGAPGDGEWLFLQEAKHATLKPVSGNLFRLTLVNPDARVQAFADRPARRFDFLSLGGFTRSWGTYGFNRVPPNAAIERQRGKGDQDVLVVELSKPKLDRRGLSYLARPLGGQRPADLRSFNRRADQHLPAKLGPVTLFIDDADDSPVLFALNIQVGAPSLWVANMSLSAAVVSYVSAGDSFNYAQQSVSSFQVSLPGGGSSSVAWLTNPLGDCVYLSGSLLTGPDSSLTGQVQSPSTGPTVPVTFPTTAIPVKPQSSCKSS